MSLRSFLATAVVALSVTTSVARAEAKFAYVDLQRALLEVDEGRAAKARLQAVLEAKQKELDKEQESLRKEKELLDKQASAMSEETRIQKQTDLQKKLYDLAQRWEKGKAEMAQREQTELRSIFAKMDAIIGQIAQREGFTMIFDKNNGGLVYAPASLDVTNELVRMYNDQNKGKPAATNTPAPAPKDAPKAPAAAPKK